jgi:hypothetical protein
MASPNSSSLVADWWRLGCAARLRLGGRGGCRLGGGCLLVHPELVDMQPRDLEVLDFEAADHRASDRQPANRQGADGPGANRRRPDRGRADANRGQEHRWRLLAAATTELHRTVGASSAVHAMVPSMLPVGTSAWIMSQNAKRRCARRSSPTIIWQYSARIDIDGGGIVARLVRVSAALVAVACSAPAR